MLADDRERGPLWIALAPEPGMRRSAACLVSCVLVCCGGAEGTDDKRISQEVEAQLALARDATVPSGVTLEQSGPTRNSAVVSTEWSF